MSEKEKPEEAMDLGYEPGGRSLREPIRDDMEMGLRFGHMLAMKSQYEGRETIALLRGLVGELTERGLIDKESLERRVESARAAEIARADRRAGQTVIEVGEPVDKYKMTDLPEIPCNELIPICKGRCCKLIFALTFQDLDEKIVEWSYPRPYMIRQGEDGYCVHNNGYTRGCGVYENRPAICRKYDCRNDKRVWIDFEKRIPAPDHAIGSSPAPYVKLRLPRKDD